MRSILVSLVFAAVAAGGPAQAANVGFNVGINIGNLPRVYASAPTVYVPVSAPAYAPPPPPVYAPAPPPMVIEERPEFVRLPELGFFAAVGVPYDLFYVSGRYYLTRGNTWYSAPNYDGPWVTARYRSLPWGLRRYPFERVRYYRDTEYRRHCDDGDWGRHARPDGEWRERRRHDNERWKEARRSEKDYSRQDRGRWRNDDDD